MVASSPILYPNVTTLPVRKDVEPGGGQTGQEKIQKGEFDKVFEQVLGSPTKEPIQKPIKFSAHAAERMQSRKIEMSPEMMIKVRDAVEKAESKGLEDALVLTKDAAFIVNVKNKTVVTALDRENMIGNVFTNIDGAVVV